MPDALMMSFELTDAGLSDEQVDAEIARAYKDAKAHASGYWDSVFRFVRFFRIRKARVGHAHWQQWKRDHLPRLGIKARTAEGWMTIVTRLEKDAPDLIPALPGMSERAVIRYVSEAHYRHHARRRQTREIVNWFSAKRIWS